MLKFHVANEYHFGRRYYSKTGVFGEVFVSNGFENVVGGLKWFR